jgi:pimeloyl-ACP methyl ester carboxylesterase
VGSGPPLVKAANWLSHIEFDWRTPIWRHWIEAFARRHAFLRYDPRGSGMSDRNPGEISFEAWVNDMAAVVDASGLDRFPLLGVSQGGAISVAYAVRHPERVTHLVLYGAFPRGRLKRGSGQAGIDEILLMTKLFELGWGTGNRAFRQVFANQFLPGGSAELLEAYDDLQRESATAADAIRILQTSAQLDVMDLAPRIRCPTLVLHARDDARVPFEEGRLFASLIPGARFVSLASRNHILLEGEPAWKEFLHEVEGFLPSAARGGEGFPGLTAREREVLELLARGLDNHQIGAHLEISEKTVRNVVSAILDKLEVESRSAAIVRAREAGFGVEHPT